MAQMLLLADDSITIQRMVTQTFAEENFEVICASNGEIAIEKRQEVLPQSILADIFMPRKTGYEVCEFVKSNPSLRHIPVVLLVGTFEPFDKREAARVGANTYLTKPFETTALVRIVRELLSQAPPPAQAPVRPVTPPAPETPVTLDFERTFQISLTDQDSRLERPAAKPADAADDILDTPLAARRVTPPDDFERTLLSEIPIPAVDMELEPDEVLISPEEEYVAEPPAEEAEIPPAGSLISPPEEAVPSAAVREPDFEMPSGGDAFQPGELPVEALPVPEPEAHPAYAFMQPDEKPTSRLVRPEHVEPPEPPEVRDDEVLELPPLAMSVQQPSNGDILGLFQLIPIEEILQKQKKLEESLQEEMALAAQPAVTVLAETEPEAVAAAEAVAEVAGIEAEAPEALEALEEIAAAEPLAVTAPPAAVAAPLAAPVARPVAAVLDEATVLKIAQLVVERLSEKVVREIAWEVVPDLVEVIIRQELEKQREKGGL